MKTNDTTKNFFLYSKFVICSQGFRHDCITIVVFKQIQINLLKIVSAVIA